MEVRCTPLRRSGLEPLVSLTDLAQAVLAVTERSIKNGYLTPDAGDPFELARVLLPPLLSSLTRPVAGGHPQETTGLRPTAPVHLRPEPPAPIEEVMPHDLPSGPVRRIGDRLDTDPAIRRRSVLLTGALVALAGSLPVRLAGASTGRPAHLTADTMAISSSVLPAHDPVPELGTKAEEPFHSGGIGPWRESAHEMSPPEQTAAVAAHPDGLHLVGDSVGTRLLPALRTRLSDRPVSWDVWNGRPTAPAATALADAAAQGGLPRDILVVLGSNDIFDPHRFAGDAAALVDGVGSGHRLFWVTPYVSRAGSPSADLRNVAVIGLALERLAAVRDDLVLVPWFELIARTASTALHDDLEDGIHPTAAGAEALADLAAAIITGTR